MLAGRSAWLVCQCLGVTGLLCASAHCVACPRCLPAFLPPKQVPVFIFELDRDEPVLIDQHYNARALEDLVMVVQNAANQ